jgi:hypothetical protein
MDELLEFIGESAGWIVGLGLTLGVAARLPGGGRPMAKKAIKGCLQISERARVMAAEMEEHIQDLYAEARMEYEADRSASAGSGPSSGEDTGG